MEQTLKKWKVNVFMALPFVEFGKSTHVMPLGLSINTYIIGDKFMHVPSLSGEVSRLAANIQHQVEFIDTTQSWHVG